LEGAVAPKPAWTVLGYGEETKRILVVDDKWENRSVLVNMLRPLGFEMTEAVDGRDGLAKAIEQRPDLVLMDLVMPVMDGFEATRRIRQSPLLKHVVVIALSASVFEHNRQESRDAGCDDFLSKPVRAEDLQEKVRAHLHLTWIYEPERAGQETRGEPVAGPMVAPPGEYLDLLLERAQKGQIVAVREQIGRIEELGAAYQPFAGELRRLAKGFQLKQLCEFVRPYLEQAR
jgi:CheY-like chemotaxis protein